MLQKHDEKNAVVGGSVNKVSFISNLDLRRGNCVTYLLQRRNVSHLCFTFRIETKRKNESRKKQQSLLEQKPELKLIFFVSIPELNQYFSVPEIYINIFIFKFNS